MGGVQMRNTTSARASVSAADGTRSRSVAMDTPRQHDTVIRTLAVVDDTSDVPRSTSLKETMVLFPKSAGFPRPRSKSGSSASDKVTLVGALARAQVKPRAGPVCASTTVTLM